MKNGLPSPPPSPPNVHAIIELLMHVNNIANPISPQRAGALAAELVEMNFTLADIQAGCKRYAMSVASQYREILLADFTNPTINSEYELRRAIKELEERESELQKRYIAFRDEVEREVERRLNDITINLKRDIANWLPDENVIAIHALYRAREIIKKQEEERIMALVPKMVKMLNQAYDDVRKNMRENNDKNGQREAIQGW